MSWFTSRKVKRMEVDLNYLRKVVELQSRDLVELRQELTKRTTYAPEPGVHVPMYEGGWLTLKPLSLPVSEVVGVIIDHLKLDLKVQPKQVIPEKVIATMRNKGAL